MHRVRLLALGLSWVASLVGTFLLTLVWEMRIDGGDYRRLYPSSLISILLIAILLLGGVSVWNECWKKRNLPIMGYTLTALFYLSVLAVITYFFTAGKFTLSRHHPNAPTEQVRHSRS